MLFRWSKLIVWSSSSMFAIRSIVKRCFSLYPNAFDISRRRTSSSKPTPHTLSNVCYSFEILSHRNNRRKNDEEDHRSTKKVSFRITKTDLMPHAQLMYEQFFRLLTSEKSYENEYVMRAVMRLSSSLQDGVVPYLNQLMEKLVLILRRAYRVSENTLNHRSIFSFTLWRIQANRTSIIISSKRSVCSFDTVSRRIHRWSINWNNFSFRSSLRSSPKTSPVKISFGLLSLRKEDLLKNSFLTFFKSLAFSWNHTERVRRFPMPIEPCSTRSSRRPSGIERETFRPCLDFFRRTSKKPVKRSSWRNWWERSKRRRRCSMDVI